ncbi:hypothetical protein HNP33_002469 [Comamonas odontotermitis]|uniref:Uncharacterized protein n=1 Tax=Comamonas odontotermitis TaxID=379895 RepID=A0ABR6RGZ3_9BURK|nr:hypothetical protein [Comamonas odontotermitis]MBB6578387.1 hypothetical protein [Comamonas odontotermitis]
MTANGKPSTLRKGVRLAVVLLVLAGLLAGFRVWKTSLENAPVDASYRDFLEFVTAQSPAARLYLGRYYQRYARDTVAARHFYQVCSSVTHLADRDGVDLRGSAWHTMTDACRRPMTDDDIHILP